MTEVGTSRRGGQVLGSSWIHHHIRPLTAMFNSLYLMLLLTWLYLCPPFCYTFPCVFHVFFVLLFVPLLPSFVLSGYSLDFPLMNLSKLF